MGAIELMLKHENNCNIMIKKNKNNREEYTMFINISNHPSVKWDNKQLEKARKFGKVVDIKFPIISSEYDEKEIMKVADEYSEKILSLVDQEGAVMVQGEFTLTFAIVNRLKSNGIKVLSACSERKVTETVDENGDAIKIVKFDFVKFREYI